MKSTKKWTWIILGGLAVIALTVGAGSAFAQASDSDTQAALAFPPFPGGGGVPAGSGEHLTYLADALGITVDELQAAYETARDAALQDAVDAGLLTQEQADALKERAGFFGRGRRPGFGLAAGPDFESYLAEALGITVDELQSAMDEAHEAALAQAVADGQITQEQADQMLAMRALRDYIDRDALMAEALGISVEDLQQARADGKSMATLLDELGLEPADFQEAMQSAHEAAIQQAVEDGVISQELADQILSNPRGPFGGRGFGPCGPGFGPRGFGESGFGPRGFGVPGNGNGNGLGSGSAGQGMNGMRLHAPASSGA